MNVGETVLVFLADVQPDLDDQRAVGGQGALEMGDAREASGEIRRSGPMAVGGDGLAIPAVEVEANGAGGRQGPPIAPEQ